MQRRHSLGYRRAWTWWRPNRAGRKEVDIFWTRQVKKAQKVEASIEQVLTAVKGLRVNLIQGGLHVTFKVRLQYLHLRRAWGWSRQGLWQRRKPSACKENLNSQTTRKRSALAAAKLAGANRSRSKVSKPKDHEGRCTVWNGNSTSHQHYAGTFQSVWSAWFDWFCTTPEFPWKYHNAKLDLTATRRSVHTFGRFNAWARPWSDFVYTSILLQNQFLFVITSHRDTFLKWKQSFSQSFSNKPHKPKTYCR